MKSWTVFAIFAAQLAVAAGPSAIAQDGPAAGMSDSPCPPSSPPPPAAMLQAMLEPGAKMPPMARPDGGAGPALEAYRKKRDADMLRDYANLCRYKAENAQQAATGKPRVVFIGDSITEGWKAGDPSLFSAAVVSRGIGGQTSPQMVVRFQQDVVALRPDVVHIMAGTNDLAGNTGPSSPEDYKNNIRSMVDLALANHIKVVLAGIPPANGFPWQPDLQPKPQIAALNTWLKTLAVQRGLVFVDYHVALAAPSGGMRPELSNDGIHPNRNGYAAMRPLVDAALAKAGKPRR